MPLFKSVNRHFLCSVAVLMALSCAAGATRAGELGDVQALLAAGHAAEGLKKIDQLLASKPTDPELQMQRGIALTQLNRPTEAIGVFQKLIEAHPELPGPYNNLAVLYGQMGNYEKARDALELGLRTNPGYETTFKNLGDVYARLAGQAHRRALALDGSAAPLPLKLASVQSVASANVNPHASAKPLTATPTPASTAAVSRAAPPPPPAPVLAAAKTAAPTPTPAPAAAPATAVVKAASGLVVASTSTAPAARVAAAPKPTAKNRVDAPAAPDTAGVEKALQRWAQAWSQRDMPAYYAAYAPDFKGKSASRRAWEEERRQRIASKRKIVVQLSDISIKLSGTKAAIRVRQNYTSDALSVKSVKNIEMMKNKLGDWQITQESSS